MNKPTINQETNSYLNFIITLTVSNIYILNPLQLSKVLNLANGQVVVVSWVRPEADFLVVNRKGTRIPVLVNENQKFLKKSGSG